MANPELPIEGMPATRPRCPWCNRQLRPYISETKDGRPVYTRNAPVDRRVFQGWQGYDNLFDRLNCARAFAVAAYNAGFRRLPPSIDVRHTACRHCGLDIEGIKPYRKGQWRDRGNNTHCSGTSRLHAPVKA